MPRSSMDFRSASFKVSNFAFQSHVEEVTKQVTDATEAELTFKICHETLQSNEKETPNSKLLTNLVRHFTNEIQTNNRHLKI